MFAYVLPVRPTIGRKAAWFRGRAAWNFVAPSRRQVTTGSLPPPRPTTPSHPPWSYAAQAASTSSSAGLERTAVNVAYPCGQD